MISKQLEINQTWNGRAVPSAVHCHLFMTLDENGLTLRLDAPFYNDPPPDGSADSTPGLWEYEVVELFLLGATGQYLEIELGPHGHSLVYLLAEVRVVERTVIPRAVQCSVARGRWQGEISIAAADLPPDLIAVNGYAIHGQGGKRCYLATSPVLGDVADFHQPDAFLPLADLPDWSFS